MCRVAQPLASRQLNLVPTLLPLFEMCVSVFLNYCTRLHLFPAALHQEDLVNKDCKGQLQVLTEDTLVYNSKQLLPWPVYFPDLSRDRGILQHKYESGLQQEHINSYF